MLIPTGYYECGRGGGVPTGMENREKFHFFKAFKRQGIGGQSQGALKNGPINHEKIGKGVKNNV